MDHFAMTTGVDTGLVQAGPAGTGLISKLLRPLLLTAYCIALLLILDVVYSNFINDDDSLARVPNANYHHGLAANFSGHHHGDSTYGFYTDSLAFRDRAMREVALRSAEFRVLLIGDSFTEGSGVSFEQSFAGLLYQSGQQRTPKIEFLNAGVGSYSPVIYYKKIKTLIEQGLKFDEVVVFSDISDVFDEAARAGGSNGNYFCIDDDPRYFAHCRLEDLERIDGRRPTKTIWKANFTVTQKFFYNLKQEIRRVRGKWVAPSKSDILYKFPVSAWTIRDFPLGDYFAPLGVEGGIARSRQNMQKLADLLAERGIALDIVVYPWPMQLAMEDRESRQAAIWRDFCAKNCKRFIDAFPAFFAEKDAHQDWYERLFRPGDVHFSAAGNELLFGEVAKHLF